MAISSPGPLGAFRRYNGLGSTPPERCFGLVRFLPVHFRLDVLGFFREGKSDGSEEVFVLAWPVAVPALILIVLLTLIVLSAQERIRKS